MAKLLKLRRGSTSQHSSFTGAEGEVTVDTDKDVLVVNDGSTAGGHPLAAEDMSNVSSASIAGRLATDSIATTKIAAGALPTDVTVASANIVNGTIVNEDVNASAAIAGTKVAPDFGSQNIATTGTITSTGNITTSGQINIESTSPRLHLDDTNSEDDFSVYNQNGNFLVYNEDDNRADITIASDGQIDFAGNVDCNSGLDVTGAITSTGGITLTNSGPRITFTDSNEDPDFYVEVNASQFLIQDATNNAQRFRIQSNGVVDIDGNTNFSNGVDVVGNITVTGTVDGVDVATRDTLFGGLTSSSGVLTNGVTATTQSASDNTTKVATTAYVTTAIGNADAFPSGTVMLFAQSSAPTGWTKQTTHNNKALRVVSGSASSGGSNAFSNTFASRSLTANAGNTTAGGNVSVSIANANTSGNVNSHTLSINEIPSHSHGIGAASLGPPNGGSAARGASAANIGNMSTGNAGGGGGHSHGFSGGSHSHNANASFSGSAHNHNISVTNLDLEVQFVDVILAAKD